MQFIESRQNKIIKEVLSYQDKKNRKKNKGFIVEGIRFVREAFLSGMKVEKVLFSSDAVFKTVHDLKPAMTAETQCFEIPPPLFSQLAETDSPQGVLAVVQIPEPDLHSSYKKGFRGLVLDSIQDPGNAGTMIRTAHALGFDAVFTTKGCVDVFNSKVLRSTMGSIFYIPVYDCMDEEELFSFCQKSQLRMIASRLEDARACHELDLAQEFLLVVGNEGKGVSSSFLEKAGEFVYIPMPGGAESLNAAVAASILMYESNRQRSAP